MPTTTIRQAGDTISMACGSTPTSPLVSTMSGGPSPVCPLAGPGSSSSGLGCPGGVLGARGAWPGPRRVGFAGSGSTGQHPGAPRGWRRALQARPIGPAPNTTTCSPGCSLAAGQGVHHDRGGLDEGRRSRARGVADPGHILSPGPRAVAARPPSVCTPTAETEDGQTWGGRSSTGKAAGTASTAAAAGSQRGPFSWWPQRVPGVLDQRGHLVALDARLVVAGTGNGASLAGKQVEVRSADTDRLGAHDNVSGTGGSPNRERSRPPSRRAIWSLQPAQAAPSFAAAPPEQPAP